ncbi:MAG: sulfatase family protein [Carbonactinosporaceae bacterium]
MSNVLAWGHGRTVGWGRRNASAGLVLITLAAVASVVPAGHGGAERGPPARPNIVLVVTDDLDAASMARLPTLRRELADRGTTFTRFFATDSLCCPSRASILRGQYVHNHRVRSNAGPHGGYRAFARLQGSTVATWLDDAGYRTGLVGKYLNGYPAKGAPAFVPTGWDDWHAGAGMAPYQGFGYHLVENGRRVFYGYQNRDYGVDVLARKSVRFIRASQGRGRPFFLYVAPYVPHLPSTPPPRYRHALAGAHAPRTVAFDRGVSHPPDWQRDLAPLSAGQESMIDWIYRQRLAAMLAVQDLVHRLVTVLRHTGRLRNTYLVFTSDNGFHLGQHRLGAGKRTAFEEDIRVPLLVRGPGVPAGRTVEALTSTIDLAPTLAQLAGTHPPEFVDGRSLVPLLHDRDHARWRRGVLVEHFDRPQIVDLDPYRALMSPQELLRVVPPVFRALRTPRYSYVEYSTGARELYDLRRDPHQLHNVAGTASPALLRGLSGILHRLATCEAGSCRTVDREHRFKGVTDLGGRPGERRG